MPQQDPGQTIERNLAGVGFTHGEGPREPSSDCSPAKIDLKSLQFDHAAEVAVSLKRQNSAQIAQGEGHRAGVANDNSQSLTVVNSLSVSQNRFAVQTLDSINVDHSIDYKRANKRYWTADEVSDVELGRERKSAPGLSKFEAFGNAYYLFIFDEREMQPRKIRALLKHTRMQSRARRSGSRIHGLSAKSHKKSLGWRLPDGGLVLRARSEMVRT